MAEGHLKPLFGGQERHHGQPLNSLGGGHLEQELHLLGMNEGMESEGKVEWMIWKGTKRQFWLEMFLANVLEVICRCTELRTIRIIHALSHPFKS